MAVPHLSSSSTGAGPVADAPLSLEQRKQRLAELLRTKIEQGFEVESQTDTAATLVTKGRRRWFGILGGDADTRQTTSIDEQGQARTRPL
jgi:hypothetical protein